MDAAGVGPEVLPSRARARVLRAVGEIGAPATVEEVAGRVGIGAATVRKHLDQLAREGAVRVESERSGRPGRPRLRYTPASPPATDPYERLALLLLHVAADGEPPEAVGRRAGELVGQRDGETPIEALVRAMAAEGFDPALTPEGADGPVLTFRRCPYATAALDAPSMVCSLHRGFASGVLGRAAGDELPPESLEVRDPRQAGCRLLLGSAVRP